MFSQYLQIFAPISYQVQSPGTSALGSNAHIVFSARTICNPGPRHYGIPCVQYKH